MAPISKCTSLGIGLPAILLMEREGGFDIGSTTAYPDDIRIIWSGTARADAETAYHDGVEQMMADEAAEVERLRAAGYSTCRNP